MSSLSDEEFTEFELCSQPHENISDLVLVDEVSISDMLSSPYYRTKLNVIGYIDHKPVIYYNEAGIYQWSDTLDKECLTYWISYPNSPPGWEIK
ncbi:hypothetical protein [Chromobacterium sp. IIBBL 290-4]|uniref:hypothetical protein n=1 Tax=Chromobacterium sp. IIBBL 290-4 TaxID=2953890 RepID=UPI0020B769FA|nr:hypothetical protein [Chromobacterium sp. IIBBL 290-4]UTH74156.1 hypothetical protein NKT35_21870 [Chromobacterium sp. IIBBL 290-4]